MAGIGTLFNNDDELFQCDMNVLKRILCDELEAGVQE
jgi:hypothetical protein